MCVSIYIWMCVCTFACVRVYIYIYIYKCACIYAYIYIYVWRRCVCVCMRACMRIYIYMGMCVYICIYIYVWGRCVCVCVFLVSYDLETILIGIGMHSLTFLFQSLSSKPHDKLSAKPPFLTFIPSHRQFFILPDFVLSSNIVVIYASTCDQSSNYTSF